MEDEVDFGPGFKELGGFVAMWAVRMEKDVEPPVVLPRSRGRGRGSYIRRKLK